MLVKFFVTGHGRSGTLWLARLLNQSPNVKVHHEPVGCDVRAYNHLYYGSLNFEKYLANCRLRRMNDVWSRFPEEGYAEVNSYLRYCALDLHEYFKVPVAAIIRDGRYVVRSMLNRGIYQKPGYPPILGEGETPFEKCCWYWAETYRQLKDIYTFKLEDLNSKYGVYAKLCRFVGIQPVEEAWQKFSGKPVNVDVGEIPLDWSEEQEDLFWDIAGDIQWRHYESHHTDYPLS